MSCFSRKENKKINFRKEKEMQKKILVSEYSNRPD